MGQQVVVLDPFHLVTARSDSLNPLDLLTLPRSDIDSDAEMLASLLAVGNEYAKEPFWNTTANGLIAGLIAHIASYPPNERHLGQLREWLYHDDMDMAIARMLDDNAVKSRMARDQFIAYLSAPHGADAAVHPDHGMQLHQRPGQRPGGRNLAGIPHSGCRTCMTENRSASTS